MLEISGYFYLKPWTESSLKQNQCSQRSSFNLVSVSPFMTVCFFFYSHMVISGFWYPNKASSKSAVSYTSWTAALFTVRTKTFQHHVMFSKPPAVPRTCSNTVAFRLSLLVPYTAPLSWLLLVLFLLKHLRNVVLPCYFLPLACQRSKYIWAGDGLT